MRRRAFATLCSGATLSWPFIARAQQRDRLYTLAILAPSEPVDRTTGKRERHWTAFFDELRRLGYEEGRNLAVAWHASQLDAAGAADLARRVAAHKPDAIYTPDVRMAAILKTVAAQTPVVAVISDPVGSGVAASLARPGGNVTGFSTITGPELVGKRLELFRQAVPTASRIAGLAPRRMMDPLLTDTTRESARLVGMTLLEVVLDAPIDAAAIRRAFDDMARQGVDSVWVATSGETREHRRLIADLALGARLPSAFGWRENVEAGGLLSYGNDAADMYRGAAGYVDRILRGANPGNLPIQLP
ncbi:MAG TPA: ABC transporter substrate-binding protein, partial [Vineibacter sp.]|nr:ABC transporter substrate-binding protein [Vineibacter sp.]